MLLVVNLRFTPRSRLVLDTFTARTRTCHAHAMAISTSSFQRLEVLTETFVFFPTVTLLAFVVILIPSLHQVLTVGSPLI